MIQHRWSGWPGALCLDCFVDDQNEICISVHDVLLTCVYGHVMCENGHPMQDCDVHVNHDCLGRDRLNSIIMCPGIADKNTSIGNCPGIIPYTKKL